MADEKKDYKFSETVGIAIGEASMCWSEVPKGVFDSTKAKELCDRIIKEHAHLLEKAKLEAFKAGSASRDEEVKELSKMLQEAKVQGFEGKSRAYQFGAEVLLEYTEECRADEDCDHCILLAYAEEYKEKAAAEMEKK